MDRRARAGRRHARILATTLLLVGGLGARGLSAQDLFLPANEVAFQNYSAEFPVVWTSYTEMRGPIVDQHIARLLREAPTSPEALEMMIYTDRYEPFVDAIEQLLASEPARITAPFELAWRKGLFSRPQPGSAAASAMQRLRSDVQAQLPRLTPDDASRIEWVLARVDISGWDPASIRARSDRLRELLARYPNTSGALRADLDLLMGASARQMSRIPVDDVNGFVKAHPGSEAAADLLYGRGQDLARSVADATDPTDRLLEVFAIAKELESGRFPAYDAVRRAPFLGIEANHRGPISSAHLDRVIATYAAFVEEHFRFPEQAQLADRIRELIENRIFDLYEQRGDGVPGIEGLLTRLERIDAPRSRFIRGSFYISRSLKSSGDERLELLRKARTTLTALIEARSGLQSRRALATLASLEFAESNFVTARMLFAAYTKDYPDTVWSWVAAIRFGQCEQLLGNLDSAILAFRSASSRYGDIPVARKLASAFAARASEQASRFDEATADYERALEDWGDPRRSVRMESYRADSTPPAWPLIDVSGLSLQERLTQLRASIETGEGPLFQQARALMAADRRDQATLAFEQFIAAYPRSPLTGEARWLLHRLQLTAALDFADPTGTQHDVGAALAALAAIEREPWDPAVGIAGIVRATLRVREAPAEADALMLATLRGWRQNQSTTSATSLPLALATDVADIRQLLTAGGGAQPSGGTNERTRFQVMNPEVMVSVGDAVMARETIYPSFSSGTMLFMTSDQVEVLVDALNTTIGQRPSKAHIRAFPQDLLTFIGQYLSVGISFMGGGLSSFASLPRVTSIQFTNPEHTRATAKTNDSSSGWTIELEKVGGTWRIVGRRMEYIV